MSETQQQDVSQIPVMVTLPVGRWQLVLEMLGTHPWREANPMIVDIHRQVQDGIQARMAPPPPPGGLPSAAGAAPPSMVNRAQP